jgi:hypothetical protein
MIFSLSMGLPLGVYLCVTGDDGVWHVYPAGHGSARMAAGACALGRRLRLSSGKNCSRAMA